jgi:hypothetical protein
MHLLNRALTASLVLAVLAGTAHSPVTASAEEPLLAQTITFPAIAARNTAAAPFNPGVTSSSGLPVTLTSLTEPVCEIEEDEIIVVDLGTCTIRASQPGNGAYSPADPADRSFAVSRVLLTNVKLTLVTDDGVPFSNVSFDWSTADGRYRASKALKTDANGQVTVTSIPAGKVHFQGQRISVGDWANNLNVVWSVSPLRKTVVMPWNPPFEVYEPNIHIRLPDGSPVPGATVEVHQWGRTAGQTSGGVSYMLCGGGNADVGGWQIVGCYETGQQNVDADGDLTIRLTSSESLTANGPKYIGQLPDGSYGYKDYVWGAYAIIRFIDGDLLVTQDVELDGSDEITVTLDQLPSVDLLNLDANVGFSSRQVVTAVALDGLGDPIVGKKLTLKPSVKGAIGTGCKSQLVATTNSVGRATFYFCPIKTTEFSVDGLSIVGSAPLLIEVRTRPSAPRSLVGTAVKKGVALTWKIPAEVNAGSITDYVVQYRLQGTTSWLTFREGVSTARSVKVTGLTTGRIYEFRVVAKNKAGGGAPSTVVVATPR